MIPRQIAEKLKAFSKKYPIVTILGPRQSGKTTLSKKTFPKKSYVNLEDPSIRKIVETDPVGFLENYPDGAIFDEIQRVPQLLSYIQVIVDKNGKKGQFILTGSHQLELQQALSQSLAGRTAILKLYPLSILELQKAKINLSLDDYLLQGFFPRIYKDKLDPTKTYGDYIQTYVERDLRQLIQVKDLNSFQQFLKVIASRVGQVLNMHSLGNDLGLSSHTIKHWLSILESSFIIFRLQPYFENFGKRILKSPKLYFTDVGLVTYLLDIETKEQVARDPLRGNLVENLVVIELVKARLNQGLEPHFYYYRDNQMIEVDLIYKSGNNLIPIEIKSSKTFHSDFIKNLDFFTNLVGERCEIGYLIYTGEYEQKIQKFKLLNFKNSATIIQKI